MHNLLCIRAETINKHLDSSVTLVHQGRGTDYSDMLGNDKCAMVK